MVEDLVKLRRDVRDRLRRRFQKRAKELGVDYRTVKIDGYSFEEAAELDGLHKVVRGPRVRKGQVKERKDRLKRSRLYLRLDEALQLLAAAKNRKEELIIRYALFNGLASGEIAGARIEHLDPVDCTLFLPKRHWKKNQICDIDRETVTMQIMYSGDRKEGPLIRSNKGGHFSREGIYYLVNHIARRTNIAGKEGISPRTLKRTFAREWLRAGGSVGSLQKQFSHRHLWSTAHYCRFALDDIKPDHTRMMEAVKQASGAPRIEKTVDMFKYEPAFRQKDVNPFAERAIRREQWKRRKYR